MDSEFEQKIKAEYEAKEEAAKDCSCDEDRYDDSCHCYGCCSCECHGLESSFEEYLKNKYKELNEYVSVKFEEEILFKE